MDRGARPVPNRRSLLRIRKLPDVGRPVIRRLLHETEETVNLAMFDGNELVVVGQAEGHAPVRAFFRLGARLPLHATARGKVDPGVCQPGISRRVPRPDPL